MPRIFLKLLGYGDIYIDWRVPEEPSRTEKSEQSIDHLVHDLFDLTQEEIAIVDACGEPGRTSTAVAFEAPA